MRLFFGSLALVVLSMSLTGCGDDSKSDDKDGEDEGSAAGPVPAALFLSTSDVQAGSNLNSLLQKDVLKVILGNTYLYDTEPKEESDATGKCFEELLDGKVTATAETLKMAYSFNGMACLKTITGMSNWSGTVTSKGYFELGCTGGDLSGLDGKLLSELEADETVIDAACADASERHSITNAEGIFNYSADFESEGTTYKLVYDSRTLGADFSGNMEPCRQVKNADGNWFSEESCIHVSREIITKNEVDGDAQEDQSTENFERFASKDLVQSSDAKAVWYVSGSFDAQVNEWEGTVSYTGVDKAATYELTSEFGTITGNIDDPKPED